MATPAIRRPGIEAALPTAPSSFAAASSDELELAERHLEHARAILAEREAEAELVAKVGAPAERIVEIADERQTDVIVVGERAELHQAPARGKRQRGRRKAHPPRHHDRA